jgi:hypothetical protein
VKKITLLFVAALLAAPVSGEEYIVIGWNDLGMHCSNQDFSTLVVLPPYNNIRAQVIRVGNDILPPLVTTANLRVTYEVPGNTYSVGKTNFWDYEDLIFGVNLAPDIGLTGAGLSGEMAAHTDHFLVDGVPLTPYTDSDLLNEDPFQLGLLQVYDLSDQLLASTQPVVPVSNEINCVSSGCHTSEQGILDLHAAEAGFDPAATPVLCASCHASNALGLSGQPGVASLSEAIHKGHGERTSDCYRCHPGPNTQCLRGVMATEHNLTCQDCHGSVTQVGESISSGREPWFEEPACGDPSCHGATYAEEPGKLFRESRGHGGLFCSACHGEPHAIVPSGTARDNVQNIALQGFAGTLKKCATCHGITPTGAGPHGLSASCCDGVRGDVNGDASLNVSDLSYLVDFLFRGGSAPPCQEEADINGDGTLNVSDLSYLVDFLFRGGPEPASCG